MTDDTAPSTLFAWLDRELWLVTAQAGGRRGGLIATFVAEASIHPELPRMLVGLAKQHHTSGLVEASGAFALHLLGEHQLHWVWRFGLHTGDATDKFDGLVVHPSGTGSPVLKDAIGWLDCRVEARLDTGDRTIYVAEVVHSEVTNYAPPLTLKRLMQLAPPEYLRELKRQRHLDAEADAESIRAWRAARGSAAEERAAP
jgi:flavin reductase (DIM6/NTAB) family NADH-FMN oxidoreductase RutF